MNEGAESAVPPSTPPAPETGPEVAITPPFGTDQSPPAIQEKYNELGGVASELGSPVGPELMLPDERGKFQVFTNGVILWTPPEFGAQVFDASILREWLPGGTGSAE